MLPLPCYESNRASLSAERWDVSIRRGVRYASALAASYLQAFNNQRESSGTDFPTTAGGFQTAYG